MCAAETGKNLPKCHVKMFMAHEVDKYKLLELAGNPDSIRPLPCEDVRLGLQTDCLKHGVMIAKNHWSLSTFKLNSHEIHNISQPSMS